MRILLVAVIALVVVSGCSRDNPPLKSPCVGVENSPCGARSSVNDHWMFS